MMSTTASRRAKWHPIPASPPSPKVIHLPCRRRTRRRLPRSAAQHCSHRNSTASLWRGGKLRNLFDQENDVGIATELLDASAVERRERVEEEEEGGPWHRWHGGGSEEERWRFQAEILRAECNFLRMEREFALMKMKKNRAKMEETLRSAVQTLVSGKDKIFEGKNGESVLEEEIEDLEQKIEELKKSSPVKDHRLQNCSNFDKKACLLQNQLEKNKSIDVDVLRKKIEGLSKGMLNKMEEEYMSMISSTANSSVVSSASTSKRIDLCPEFSNLSSTRLNQEPLSQDRNKCSGRCKAVIRRVVEQVRAETEQWSQMQDMLGHVRIEMEELRTSRDYWENRALGSEHEIRSVVRCMEEWKETALEFENKANELQLELFSVKQELQEKEARLIPPGRQLDSERDVSSRSLMENCWSDDKENTFENAIKELSIEQREDQTQNRGLPPLSLGKQLAKEKRMMLRRLKETRRAKIKQDIVADETMKTRTNGGEILASKRAPLRDIGMPHVTMRED